MRSRVMNSLWLSVLVTGLLAGTPSAAGLEIPGGATHVAVSSGVTTSGIDAHLLQATGSITVKVISKATSKPVYAWVTLFRNGRHVAEGESSDGNGFTFKGLVASSTGYVACAGFSDEDAPTYPYLGRCYKTAAWDIPHSTRVPAGATPVPLADGQHKTIGIALLTGGGIAGHVTTRSGTPIPGTGVVAFNRSSGAKFGATTNAHGYYRFWALTPSSSGYAVCATESGLGTTGYRPRCYQDVAWSGSGRYPSSATGVSVRLGSTHYGIGVQLRRAAAVAGRVTDAATGNGASAVNDVEVFSATDHLLATAFVGRRGYYRVKSLPAQRGIQVCVRPYPGVVVGYRGQCWRNVAWDGGALPGATTGIRTTIAETRAGIDFRLTTRTLATATIRGTVTEAASGQPLANADVLVFRGQDYLGWVKTGSSGTYRASSLLPSSSGYTVCADAGLATSTTPKPSTGWAPRCYGDVAWYGTDPNSTTGSNVPVPGGGALVPLSGGQTRTGIDIALPIGGAITGTVRAAGTTTPLTDGLAILLTPQGAALRSATPAGDGTYSFTGLTPEPASDTTGYLVCFWGFSSGYQPQCYDRVAWDNGPRWLY